MNTPIQAVNSLFNDIVQPLGTTTWQQVGRRILYTDIVRYTSMVIDVEQLREKEITLNVSEINQGCTGGGTAIMGPLWIWVSISNDGINYTALGGQTSPNGLAPVGFPPPTITPLNPVILNPTANTFGPIVMDRKHLVTIPWSIHSRYARLEVRQPVAGSVSTAVYNPNLIVIMWVVSAFFGGRA